MKKITLLFAFLLAMTTQSYGQVNSYLFTTGTSGVLDPMTGSTQLFVTPSDDSVSAVLAIGFTFNYAGTNYSQYSVNTNGLVRLGATVISTAYSNSATNANAETPVIMPYWDDLATGTVPGGGKVHSRLIGSAPNRKLIIEWFVTVPRVTSNAANARFQCVLEETTNVITFVYGSGMVTNTTNSGASIGLATATTVYNTVDAATNTNSTTTFTTTNTTAIAAGRTYTFTPPVPCTGTPTAGTVAPANLALCSGSLPGDLTGTGYSLGVSGLTFQWEESTNGGASYVNALGGTNATTTIYTPPAYAGTPIRYRMRVTCTNSAAMAYSTVCIISNATTPSTQATTLAGTPAMVTADLNWVNGNGGRRVVYFSNSATFTNPIDGNGPALVANTVYAGSGQQLVYDGTASNVTVTGLTGSTTYFVKVYEYVRCGAGPYDYYYNVTTGTNILTITTLSPPANDNLVNATAISCGNNYSGSTIYASLDEDSAPDGFGVDMDSPNVWYSFTGTGAAQAVTLDLCASTYDSSVLVYTGTSGNLTLIAANDDDVSCGASSKVIFNSDGATTYYIAIEGYSAANIGAYSMTVSCVVNPPAVANQDCGTSLAVSVNGTNTISNNTFGTISAAHPTCDPLGTMVDVWFSFVAPASGSVDCLVTNGTMTSANFVVYSGACGTLTEVAASCNSNLTAPTTEAMTGLVAGNTYYVQVWSSSTEQGTFTLRLSEPPLSTESFDSNGFSAYPNPVKNTLNVSYTQNISEVAVYNLLGQQVIAKAIHANQSQIDMSGLASGTYIVKITADNQVKMIKVVKE